MTTPEALPSDPEDLRQYCAQLLAELGEKQQLIDKLAHQLALFRRYLYGRRSEQLDPAQLLLEFASWVQAQQYDEAAPAPPVPVAPVAAPPRAGHGRTPLPALLPRRCRAAASSIRCPRSGVRAPRVARRS